MGLFNKKKNSSMPDSVLSESEIQKKLYGEFSSGASHVEVGEREHYEEPIPHTASVKIPSSEKPLPADLFNLPKETPVEPPVVSRPSVVAPKDQEHTPRYVPLHDFESKTVHSAPSSTGTDPYARFRQNKSAAKILEVVLAFLKELWGKILDPKQVAFRRIIYWGIAVVVVFLLFWGVNSLNSQREEAMRTRYKMPGGVSVSVKEKVQETAVVPPAPVEERPVVITPVPVKPSKKSRTTGSSVKPSGAINGSYVIQVVTYPDRQDAEQVVASFKRVALNAFVQEDTRPSGRLFYVVLLGGFRTEAEAQAALLKFRAKEVARPFQDAFVKARRS